MTGLARLTGMTVVSGRPRLAMVAAVAALAALATGCTSAGGPVRASSPAQAGSLARASSQARASGQPPAHSQPPAPSQAAGRGTPKSSASAHAEPTVRFSGQGLSFRYPAAWHAATWDEVSSFSALIVALSTARQHNPCTVTSGGGVTRVVCGEPVRALAPGGIVVTWSSHGFPGKYQPTANTTVGGHPASQSYAMATWCAALRGSQSITVVIELGPGNWIQMDACLRAPGLSRPEAQITAMLNSVRVPAPA